LCAGATTSCLRAGAAWTCVAGAEATRIVPVTTVAERDTFAPRSTQRSGSSGHPARAACGSAMQAANDNANARGRVSFTQEPPWGAPGTRMRRLYLIGSRILRLVLRGQRPSGRLGIAKTVTEMSGKGVKRRVGRPRDRRKLLRRRPPGT